MMMFTHSSCSAVNGASKPKRMETNTVMTEAMFTVSWKLMKRLKFS